MGHGTHDQERQTPDDSQPVPHPNSIAPPIDRMAKWFLKDHPIADLQEINSIFFCAAESILDLVPHGPERTVCLRKLLEAKDCAIRASAVPHG